MMAAVELMAWLVAPNFQVWRLMLIVCIIKACCTTQCNFGQTKSCHYESRSNWSVWTFWLRNCAYSFCKKAISILQSVSIQNRTDPISRDEQGTAVGLRTGQNLISSRSRASFFHQNEALCGNQSRFFSVDRCTWSMLFNAISWQWRHIILSTGTFSLLRPDKSLSRGIHASRAAILSPDPTLISPKLTLSHLSCMLMLPKSQSLCTRQIWVLQLIQWNWVSRNMFHGKKQDYRMVAMYDLASEFSIKTKFSCVPWSLQVKVVHLKSRYSRSTCLKIKYHQSCKHGT